MNPTAQPNQTQLTPARPGRTCHDCVFAHFSPARCLTAMATGWSAGPTCVNRADKPGQIADTPIGRVCRNFRPKRKPPVRRDPPPPPNDKVRYIALTRGKFAIVDAADYKRLSRYRWNAFESGGKTYARRSTPGGTILMHREIMKPPPGMVVDHINGNSLDNRRCNLRICTPQQNEHNKPPRGRSPYKGVYPHRDKWQAVIKHQGTTHHLGTFTDPIKAARARDRKAKQLQGPYAYLNFPQEDEECHPG